MIDCSHCVEKSRAATVADRRPCGAMKPMQLFDRARAARDHLELGVEALEVELADDGVMALLDQELPRARLELLLDAA